MPDITCAGAWCRSCTTAERGHSGAVRGTDTTCGRADCGESSALTTTSICCTSCTTCSAASASTVRRSRASRSTSGHHAAVQAVHGRSDDGGGRPYRRSRLVKLRPHLVLLIVVAIIPAVAVSAVALDFFAAQTKTTVETSLLDTARALSLAVERDVRSTVSALNVLAESADLQRGDLRAFHGQATPVLRAWPAWDNLVVFDVDGQELLDLRVPFGTPLPRSDGTGLNARAIRAGFAVSDVFTGRVTPAPKISVHVPVSVDGQIRYMLAAWLRIDSLSDLLAEQRVPASSVGTLLDRNKIVVAQTRGGERHIGQPAPPDLADHITEMAEGHFSPARE